MSKANNDLVEEWYRLPDHDPRTLPQYMGMTDKQYSEFVANPVQNYWAIECNAKPNKECTWNRCPMNMKFVFEENDSRKCPLKDDPNDSDNPCGF